jgi:hypothetical protein
VVSVLIDSHDTLKLVEARVGTLLSCSRLLLEGRKDARERAKKKREGYGGCRWVLEYAPSRFSVGSIVLEYAPSRFSVSSIWEAWTFLGGWLYYYAYRHIQLPLLPTLCMCTFIH